MNVERLERLVSGLREQNRDLATANASLHDALDAESAAALRSRHIAKADGASSAAGAAVDAETERRGLGAS